MRRMMWGLLIAAGSILPGLASAQDGDRPGSRREWRADATQGEPQPQPPRIDRPGRGDDGQRRGGEGQRQAWRNRPDMPARPAEASPSQQVQPQGRFGNPGDGQRAGWRDRESRRPNWQAETSPPQRVQPQDRFGNPGDDQRAGWRGRNGQRPNWNNGGDAGRPAWNGNGPGQRFDADRGNGARSDWRDRSGRGDADRGLNGVPNGAFDRGDPRVRRGDDGRDRQRNGQRRQPFTAWQRDRADWNDHGRDDSRFGDRSSWNRSWRDDRRYDWNRYRSINRGAYHLPRYYAPGGWDGGYRRFSVGVRLNSILFAQDYWIDDPWDYRLPPADFPYRWVRYYDDALLVDVRYGQVVDVVYGIFW